MNQSKVVEKLKLEIAEFPLSPGVYIMKDSTKKIIYVGKALALRNRVRSYFSGKQTVKTQMLVSRVHSIEYIVTGNEYEALLLENSLIKKWKPRYNINLKDGKSYPVIRITNEEFPRVFRTRTIIQDGSEYFGPYPSAGTVDEYMELIRKLFPLRLCANLKSRKKECLYYHIGRCEAPCTGKIDEKKYRSYIIKIRSLLNGKTVTLINDLNKEMKQEAQNLHFEKAASLRDAIKAIEHLNLEQKVVDFNSEKRDYIDFQKSGSWYVFTLIQMREGMVSDRSYFISEYYGEDDQEALGEFLIQYYGESRGEDPVSVCTRASLDEEILRYFSEERGMNTLFKTPENKKEIAVLNMVRQNAREELNKKIRKEGDLETLKEMKKVLKLPRIPKRIEGFDIAQLHGKFTVSSMVSFKNGNPDKKNYRHFKMKSLKTGEIDDYKSLSEAVARRYSRVLNEDLPKPDLILIDGGKGQLNAVYGILESLGLEKDIPLASLAKKEELVFRPDEEEPIDLPDGDPVLRVLQYVRDETHRFATSHNQNLRKKQLKLSSLESVPGIGRKRSQKLLTSYGSLDAIAMQSEQDIASTAGVALEVAETVKLYLAKKGERHDTH